MKKAASVSAYLKAIPAGQRAALQKLRKAIQSAAPKAKLGISYGIPIFKWEGHMLVGFTANKNDCSFHVCSGRTLSRLERAGVTELKKWKHTIEAIHFTPEKPLPTALVKKLVKVRILENIEKYG